MSKITMNALIKRINRRLAKQGPAMRKTRGRERLMFGKYYIADTAFEKVLFTNVDPVEYGRVNRVLRPGESVEE